ncbi:unnamed protein product [Brassica oleracea var. botrytis]
MKHLLHKFHIRRNSDTKPRLRKQSLSLSFGVSRTCCRWRIGEENGRDRVHRSSGCLSTNGLDVWLMDADGNALSRATTAISSSVNRFVSKGLMTKARFSR